jgi:hypothetical protein
MAADEPPMTETPVTLADGGEGAVVDGMFAPAQAGMVADDDALPRGGPIRRRLRARLQRRGLGCWATHESMGCGSCKAERIFMFGSCREFFGEPCLQTAPPPLPGLSYGPTRCNCP